MDWVNNVPLPPPGERTYVWDSALDLPIPPVNAVAPDDVSMMATAFFSTIALIAFCYSLYHWKSKGSVVPLLITLGGGLTVVVEPFVNLLGGCWHPVNGQDEVFRLLGRPIPWWIVAVYFAYFGAQGVAMYLMIKKGAKRVMIASAFAVPLIADIIIELTLLPTGLYIYVGNQPLILAGWLPLWWICCNSIGVFVGVSLIVMLEPYLTGPRKLLILLLPSIGDMVGYSAVGLPSWVVINMQTIPNWLVQTGGVATFILTGGVVYLLCQLLGSDSPHRIRHLGPVGESQTGNRSELNYSVS